MPSKAGTEKPYSRTFFYRGPIIRRLFALICRSGTKAHEDNALISLVYISITESSYQYYEHGKHEPGINIAIKLVDYFNISTDYLLGRSDNPERI